MSKISLRPADATRRYKAHHTRPAGMRQSAPRADGASIAVENVGVGHYAHHIFAPHRGAAPHCLLLKRCWRFIAENEVIKTEKAVSDT